MTVKEATGATIPASEYTVSYSNNTNPSTATITISNVPGNYYVYGTTTFTIAPLVKKPIDDLLSFPQDNYTVELGEEFESPQLNNPKDFDVTYDSSDETKATVDKLTGVVTIKGEGTVIITATFDGNDEYEGGTVQYELTITPASGIQAITAKALQGKRVYNLRGQRVEHPTKGLYIVDGKKVFLK